VKRSVVWTESCYCDVDDDLPREVREYSLYARYADGCWRWSSERLVWVWKYNLFVSASRIYEYCTLLGQSETRKSAEGWESWTVGFVSLDHHVATPREKIESDSIRHRGHRKYMQVLQGPFAANSMEPHIRSLCHSELE
jgi:hypothetical protein